MTPLEQYNEQRHSIADIWQAVGNKCPLLVRFYDEGESIATLVTQVCKGKAYGFPLVDGKRAYNDWYPNKAKGSVLIPRCETKEWKLIDMPYDNIDDIFFKMDLHGRIVEEPETAAELQIDPMIDPMAIIPFGKYNGKTVGEVVNKDPGYLEWALKNITAMKDVVYKKLAA